MTAGSPWTIETGDDPIIATAIHAGHDLRADVAELMKLPEADRLREEDPFTDHWVGAAANSIVVHRSRFELDLNRPREKAIYVVPEDAWGLDVWRSRPPDDMVAESLRIYDEFYDQLGALCDRVVDTHGHVVVLDLHSYNHRRSGPTRPVDDPELNPEINLGTESIPSSWRSIVDAFSATMRELPFDDDVLDVRENVKFKGGAMTRWLNGRYQDRGCSIAVEMKKIYIDEWTGQLDEDITTAIGQIINSAAESVRAQLAER